MKNYFPTINTMFVVADPPIDPSPSDLGSLISTKNTEIIPLKICKIKMMPVMIKL